MFSMAGWFGDKVKEISYWEYQEDRFQSWDILKTIKHVIVLHRIGIIIILFL